MFFSGGGGGGEEELQGTTAETFSKDDASSKHPCFMLYIIYCAVFFFAATCLQAITKGVLDPRLPRTPRNSGYDFYTHAVYVVMCYISITCICLLYVLICYMSVKCYVSVRGGS
jgi:hypothetical protein